MKKIHIGTEIEKVWRKSGMTGVDFAKVISLDRQVIYDIFGRKSIKTDLLVKISKVLEHDFFDDYSRALKLKKDK